jgi:AcrR family transcriptional regulator
MNSYTFATNMTPGHFFIMGIIERKKREKERRRQEIINAAEHLFFSKGIHQTSMEDIARKAELSKGTLYLYFESKEDLQFAIFRKGSEILYKYMTDKLSNVTSGLEKIIQLGRSFIEFSIQQKNYFSLFKYFETSNLNFLKIKRNQIEKYITKESPLALVYQSVKEGLSDGSIKGNYSAPVLATTLWTQLLGLLIVLENKKEITKMFQVETEDILMQHFNLILGNGLQHK